MTFEGPGKYIWEKPQVMDSLLPITVLIQVHQLILIKYLLGELE